MVSNSFRTCILAVALVALAPLAPYAQVGNSSEISPPMVIVPQTTPAPQTPAYPTPRQLASKTSRAFNRPSLLIHSARAASQMQSAQAGLAGRFRLNMTTAHRLNADKR
jgi:hypothetical protein